MVSETFSIVMTSIIKKLNFFFIFFAGIVVLPNLSYAYPVFSQKSYPDGPREISGKIVCANCHLGEKVIETEIPRAVLPDTVFDVIVSVPYDASVKQLGADGGGSSMLVASVVVLPEGFELAPPERLSQRDRSALELNYVQPYSSQKKNILLAGPCLPGEEEKESAFSFPIISPSATQDRVKFLTYEVFVGLNVGRGQVYPTGEKSNNNPYLSEVKGQVVSIKPGTKGKKEVVIATATGNVSQLVPAGLCLSVDVKDMVNVGDEITLDPNQGGFGQAEGQLVFQDPNRIKGMILFFFTVIIAEIVLVIKKRQFEKVQLSEMNF